MLNTADICGGSGRYLKLLVGCFAHPIVHVASTLGMSGRGSASCARDIGFEFPREDGGRRSSMGIDRTLNLGTQRRAVCDGG